MPSVLTLPGSRLRLRERRHKYQLVDPVTGVRIVSERRRDCLPWSPREGGAGHWNSGLSASPACPPCSSLYTRHTHGSCPWPLSALPPNSTHAHILKMNSGYGECHSEVTCGLNSLQVSLNHRNLPGQ